MPNPALPSLLEFSKMIRDVADANAKDFDHPESDFHPIMVTLPGEGTYKVFDLPGELLGSQEGKDVLAEQIMVPLIGATGAKMLAWTMSAYSLELTGKSEAEARASFERAQRDGMANHPDAVEVVMVNTIDSHDMESWAATIFRNAVTPPTLGPWRDFLRKAEMKAKGVSIDQRVAEGRFVEPLQAALRDSSGQPDAIKLIGLLARFGAMPL